MEDRSLLDVADLLSFHTSEMYSEERPIVMTKDGDDGDNNDSL